MFPRGTLSAARVVARVGGDRLLLFSIVDDHAHFVVCGTRQEAGLAASALSRALGAAGAPARQAAFVGEVEGRSHLESLVRYTSRQVAKHGLGASPATWPGSSAPDLLGVRRLAGFDPGRIAAALPRLDVRGAVASACGVRVPAPASAVGLSEDDLYAAALAAGGVTAEDRDLHAVAVRVAWASFGMPVDSVPARTWRGLRAREADPRLVDAIQRRIGLLRLTSGASAENGPSSAAGGAESGESRGLHPRSSGVWPPEGPEAAEVGGFSTEGSEFSRWGGRHR